jgi:hypothetical protein
VHRSTKWAADVAVGSIATLSLCPRHVRYAAAGPRESEIPKAPKLCGRRAHKSPPLIYVKARSSAAATVRNGFCAGGTAVLAKAKRPWLNRASSGGFNLGRFPVHLSGA